MARKANGNGKARGKRTKRGGAKADKADTAEMRKGGELDLKQVAIDDADFDMHLRAMKGAKDRMATAKNLYDGCCKAAKKVSEDLLVAVKKAIKFEGMDLDDIKRALEIDGYVLRKTGSPVQLTIHDSLMGDVNQAADTCGYRDARAGKVAKSRYPESSDLHELYMAGWQRGTRENMGLDPEDDGDAVKGNGLGHNSAGAHEAVI